MEDSEILPCAVLALRRATHLSLPSTEPRTPHCPLQSHAPLTASPPEALSSPQSAPQMVSITSSSHSRALACGVVFVSLVLFPVAPQPVVTWHC